MACFVFGACEAPRCQFMQEVTPNEVASAVSTDTMTCKMVFQVSLFMVFNGLG